MKGVDSIGHRPNNQTAWEVDGRVLRAYSPTTGPLHSEGAERGEGTANPVKEGQVTRKLALAVLLVVLLGCGDSQKPPAKSNNPLRDRLERPIVIDGTAFPSRYEFETEAKKWDWAQSVLDYTAGKIFLPNTPGAMAESEARRTAAEIRSSPDLLAAILHDRQPCPACKVRHHRVRDDLLMDLSRVISTRPGDEIYERDSPVVQDSQELLRVLAALRGTAREIPEPELLDLLRQAESMQAIDRAVDGLKQRKYARANDPDALVDYAIGEFRWARATKSAGPAQRGVEACDEALKLAPTHWRAQSWKATILLDWGGRGDLPEVTRILTALADQQERGQQEERFSTTYVDLANAFLASESPEKAREAIDRGLRLYPRDSSLLALAARVPKITSNPRIQHAMLLGLDRDAGSLRISILERVKVIRPFGLDFNRTEGTTPMERAKEIIGTELPREVWLELPQRIPTADLGGTREFWIWLDDPESADARLLNVEYVRAGVAATLGVRDYWAREPAFGENTGEVTDPKARRLIDAAKERRSSGGKAPR
jgi:tetratricopeptide (TPR) repeat protein